MATLEEIKKQIKVEECRWCHSKLDKDSIDMYPHEGGWTIDGMDKKQWLSIHCNGCGYDWSLWKLGVPRE